MTINTETLIEKANQNRLNILDRISKGEIPNVNEKTITEVKKPVTMLMRPIHDEEPKDEKGNKLVRVHIYGKGFTEVAACKEVLPERKTLI